MNRTFQDADARDSDETAPTEAWLFAQAILGKPIPKIVSPETRARAKREELKLLAQSSSYHAEELRRLEAAEAEVRHDRELLEWVAGISSRAEATLRNLVRQEAEEREAWRRAEQYAERLREDWDSSKHPRGAFPQNRGWWSPTGGAPSTSGAFPEPNQDAAVQGIKPPATTELLPPSVNSGQQSRAHAPDSDKGHDLTLQDALKDGKLSVGDIVRIKFSDDEIKQILKSAEKPGSPVNLTLYTAKNLSARLRARAEADFPNLPGDEKYAKQASISNQNRARLILTARDPKFQEYVARLYDLMRSLNPTHFMVEKGIVVATGKEPVLGGEASRLDALKDMLIYVAIMKGVSWGIGKATSILAGPEVAGEITITFNGGGKLTIRRGAEYSPETLESAVERAAAGREVEINPPTPKPIRPSLTEVPSIKDDPKAFRRWFNELTLEEFKTVWSNPKLRKTVEDGLRWPKGEHEWLMIARAPKFKEWGLTAEQIAEMRTPTSKIRFKNPPGGHAGKGATTTHNQILKIIDSSPDFGTFKTGLQKWANDRLEGGADALPPGLRP